MARPRFAGFPGAFATRLYLGKTPAVDNFTRAKELQDDLTMLILRRK